MICIDKLDYFMNIIIFVDYLNSIKLISNYMYFITHVLEIIFCSFVIIQILRFTFKLSTFSKFRTGNSYLWNDRSDNVDKNKFRKELLRQKLNSERYLLFSINSLLPSSWETIASNVTYSIIIHVSCFHSPSSLIRLLR